MATLSHLVDCASIPWWENQSLYDLFGGRLVLVCLLGTSTSIKLASQTTLGGGTIETFASGWLIVTESAITQNTDDAFLFLKGMCGVVVYFAVKV